MPIPDYQSIMLHLLQLAKDQNEHGLREAINYISDLFQLTEEERREKLPSGYDRIIDNRVGWARTYLKKAELLEDPKRGYFKITPRGLGVLEENPSKIDVKFLMRYSEFKQFQTVHKKEPEAIKEAERSQTPEEILGTVTEDLKENLAQELLEKLHSNSPEFFEKVVIQLLYKMGYGIPEYTGGPGDGGIDGIIHQDRLGIDRIYLQAKRFAKNNIVTSNMVKQFLGTLDSIKADKGVFITTSEYYPDALRVAEGTNKKVILIDGRALVDLMIENNLGVALDGIYEVKSIDTDFFEE